MRLLSVKARGTCQVSQGGITEAAVRLVSPLCAVAHVVPPDLTALLPYILACHVDAIPAPGAPLVRTLRPPPLGPGMTATARTPECTQPWQTLPGTQPLSRTGSTSDWHLPSPSHLDVVPPPPPFSAANEPDVDTPSPLGVLILGPPGPHPLRQRPSPTPPSTTDADQGRPVTDMSMRTPPPRGLSSRVTAASPCRSRSPSLTTPPVRRRSARTQRLLIPVTGPGPTPKPF